MATSGALSEPIAVEFDEPPSCLAAPETDQELSVFLAILLGTTIAGLYGQDGARLLELNVRAFLQARGAVYMRVHLLFAGPARVARIA
jgi:hypothetical protein